MNVSIFNDEGEIVHEDAVTLVDNVVQYTLAPEMTKHAGDYAAFFAITFDNNQQHTYKMPFAVLPKNIERTENDTTGDLTPESTDLEIEQALGSDIRARRKMGKDTKSAYEAAQESIGRRLIK